MRTLKIFCAFVISAAVFSGCSSGGESVSQSTAESGSNIQEEADDSYLNNMPVYRALAARMISIIFGNGGIEGESSFSDVEENQWYTPYINNVSKSGIMRGDGHSFDPMEPLTYSQAQMILKNAGIEAESKNIENGSVPISYKLWCDMLFGSIEDKLNDYGVEKKEISIFATAGEGGMESWRAASDAGVFKHGGIYMDSFVDTTIEVYVKNDEIIAVMGIRENRGIFEGAYAVNNGLKTEIIFNNGKRVIENDSGTDISEGVWDITTSKGRIVSAKSEYEKISDKVIKFDQGVIETESGNKISAGNMRVYSKTESGVQYTDLKIISGGQYDIYEKDGSVKVTVFDGNFNGLMRIVISNDDFKGYIHNKAELAGNITIKNAGKTVFKGSEINISPDNDSALFKNGNRIIIDSKEGIELKSLKRSYPDGRYPLYSGTIEIEKMENGYIIVNETDMESYIEGVLLSEMPESYGLTALKAQAICARSYGYNQFFSGKYTKYGADCDDSVMCQVYNNIPVTEKAKEAVESTKGVCLVYNDKVINASFFASSSGATASSSQVWADSTDGSFPSAAKEYLSARNNTGVDFSDEKETLNYFKNTNAFAYDSYSKWFRWNLYFSAEDIANCFIKNIKPVYEKGLADIHSGNMAESDFMEKPGKLTGFDVLQRGDGGNIMALRLTFENGSADIYTEYNIRTVLRPVSYSGGNITLNLNDGSTVSNYSMLPSAFFSPEKSYDSKGMLIGVRFYGGGMGHGCGMSQNGAKYLADQGKTEEEILSIYYKNTQLKNMY